MRSSRSASSRARRRRLRPGAQAFPDCQTARATIEPLLAPTTTVLVKASRVMGLDRLVKALAAEANGNGGNGHGNGNGTETERKRKRKRARA